MCSVLRPRQHSIGYMGDGFYRAKDPTNSIKVLKEKAVKENNPKNTKKTRSTAVAETCREISFVINQKMTLNWLGKELLRQQFHWTVNPMRFCSAVKCEMN